MHVVAFTIRSRPGGVDRGRTSFRRVEMVLNEEAHRHQFRTYRSVLEKNLNPAQVFLNQSDTESGSIKGLDRARECGSARRKYNEHATELQAGTIYDGRLVFVFIRYNAPRRFGFRLLRLNCLRELIPGWIG